jgi:hypothetical protein
VEIPDYDPGWPGTFTRLRGKVAGTLGPLALRIERELGHGWPGAPGQVWRSRVPHSICGADPVSKATPSRRAIEAILASGWASRALACLTCSGCQFPESSARMTEVVCTSGQGVPAADQDRDSALADIAI